MNIVETAVLNGSFNTLVAAVADAGLVETLSGTGPFAVFAPLMPHLLRCPLARSIHWYCPKAERR